MCILVTEVFPCLYYVFNKIIEHKYIINYLINCTNIK